MRLTRPLLLLVLVWGVLLGFAGPASAQDDPPVVKVGTEGVYPPFSYRDPDTN